MNRPASVTFVKHAVTSVVILMLGAIFVTPLHAENARLPARRILILFSEDPDNYKAHETMPVFARTLEATNRYQVTLIKGQGELTAFRFPGLPDALAKTDLLIFFARRIALPHDQLNALKGYFKAGKPLVALRTANHGFAPRGKIADGHAAWPEFVADILGCENRGYGPASAGTDVAVAPESARHSILNGVPTTWHSKGNVYHVAPLVDPAATVLLTGTIPNKVEPVAWTRIAGESRVFYTSLAHPGDFETQHVPTLLLNGVRWALNEKSNDAK